jgi:uncharacterized protein YjbI with pentapeptide repeats
MDIPERKDLRGANLQGVDLIETNLQGANLQEANLRGANLEEANLQEADLTEANLQGARNLSLYQLSKVKTLHDTKLDEELLIQFKKKYPTLFE